MLFSSSNFGIKSTATKKDRSSRENIVTILFIAVTIALEYFLESGIFICPEERYYSYSVTFLLGPCIPLYCLSLILSYEFNRTLSGFCVFWMNRGIQKNRFRNRLRYFLRNVFTSFIKCCLAPATWFTIALMKKQMYVCAKVGPKSIYLGNNVTEAKYEELAGRAQSESQIFGWLIFMSGITIASIAFTIKQCFTLPSNEPDCIELDPLDTYTAYEADNARDYFESVLKKAAKENGCKKVDFLFGKQTSNADYLEDSCTLNISYENIIDVRERMLNMYPRLNNPMDESLPWYDNKIWTTINKANCKREDIFINENGVKDKSISPKSQSCNGTVKEKLNSVSPIRRRTKSDHSELYGNNEIQSDNNLTDQSNTPVKKTKKHSLPALKTRKTVRFGGSAPDRKPSPSNSGILLSPSYEPRNSHKTPSPTAMRAVAPLKEKSDDEESNS